jgi:hypothetical protein
MFSKDVMIYLVPDLTRKAKEWGIAGVACCAA